MHIRSFILSSLLLTFLSCESGQTASRPSSGLTNEANAHLVRGDLTSAINQQVSGPTHNLDCAQRGPASAPSLSESDDLFTRDRPSKLKGKEKNKLICQKRARLARSRGVHSLTIGFEGLMTYSSLYAKSFYRYYDKLWKGEVSARAPRSLGNYVGKDLFAPNLKSNFRKSDFLLLSERGGANFIEDCVAEYRKEIGASFKVNIVGLSFGAGEAMVLSEKLKERKEFGPEGIKVNNLMTMDLRGSERAAGVGPRVRMNDSFVTPSNVDSHMNFGRFNAIEPAYISPRVGYPGYRAQGSGRRGASTINRLVPTMAGHATQVKRSEIQNHYRSLF